MEARRRLDDFPYCCTAAILMDFGDDIHGEYPTKERLQQKFKEILEDELVHKGMEDPDEEAHEGKGIIVATTTTKQTEANEFLKEEGFLCVGPYAKDKHPESGLYLWWYIIKGIYGTEG